MIYPRPEGQALEKSWHAHLRWIDSIYVVMGSAAERIGATDPTLAKPVLTK